MSRNMSPCYRGSTKETISSATEADATDAANAANAADAANATVAEVSTNATTAATSENAVACWRSYWTSRGSVSFTGCSKSWPEDDDETTGIPHDATYDTYNNTPKLDNVKGY